MPGEVDQLLEVGPGGAGPSGVVRVAEHDDIGSEGRGEIWEEVILGGARHVHDAIVLLGALVETLMTTSHHGGVHVHRVRWILHMGEG